MPAEYTAIDMSFTFCYNKLYKDRKTVNYQAHRAWFQKLVNPVQEMDCHVDVKPFSRRNGLHIQEAWNSLEGVS